MSEGGVLEPDESRQADAREHANRLIQRAEAEAATADRSVETAVETGEPASKIVDYAEHNAVDHIVIGGHGGPKGMLGRLLGTVATVVVSEAPVTVTVVR
jgi:nucleotide-binding universal stress UspA family protein